MKSKINIILITLFYINNIYSQSTLTVGSKTPTIDVTNSFLKKNINLEDKFIVLDFWNPECSSCLDEISHLNKLAIKYKSNKNLIFLSITYRNIDEIKSIIKIIPFETNIIIDETAKSFKDFDRVRKGDYGAWIDYETILIDNKGIIKWIDSSKNLNEEIIENFLNNKTIFSVKDNYENNYATNIDTDTPATDEFLLNINSKYEKVKYSFTLSSVQRKEQSVKKVVNKIDDGIYVCINENLKRHISNLTSISELKIITPQNRLENFNIIYKNRLDKLNNTEELIKSDVKFNLLRTLNLKEYLENKTTEVYVLSLVDKNKLENSIDNGLPNQLRENKSYFFFNNTNTKYLCNKISEKFNYIVEDESNLTTNFNFILNKNNIEEIIKNLSAYGLQLKKQTREIQFNVYK
ncbi:TlpA family protein disulfide reductase [Flavobacterium flavigenum]|uniref:TlpA family protein disulfide reductase n=1 Tax=Flavobacterium flavigenum TaxID=3003258 RepID=UPI002483299B|nr:redoxin domain-containing protein [Flavobacterium flavigenum]